MGAMVVVVVVVVAPRACSARLHSNLCAAIIVTGAVGGLQARRARVASLVVATTLWIFKGQVCRPQWRVAITAAAAAHKTMHRQVGPTEAGQFPIEHARWQ